MRTSLCGMLLISATAMAEPPSKLFYTSQADFIEMNLSLKTADDANPRYIGLSVVLSPEAKARTARVSAQAMNNSLTLYLNGRQLSTATVKSVLDSGKLRFLIPREMLVELMPSLMK
ncbi:hypothetical protein AA957_07435 [Pseudomonas trivialis]|uniref:Uncharacterized protein n=1 Tax=Pseudomonas trivialis TaxID=200450 RepID=A0A0H5AG48_9PSED|nr:hypothetical protein AA957_07435 [Pseudomonas trivialis]